MTTLRTVYFLKAPQNGVCWTIALLGNDFTRDNKPFFFGYESAFPASETCLSYFIRRRLIHPLAISFSLPVSDVSLCGPTKALAGQLRTIAQLMSRYCSEQLDLCPDWEISAWFPILRVLRLGIFTTYTRWESSILVVRVGIESRDMVAMPTETCCNANKVYV